MRDHEDCCDRGGTLTWHPPPTQLWNGLKFSHTIFTRDDQLGSADCWNIWGGEVLDAQSCLTLCSPMDCSPPRSSVHGIFQATILEYSHAFLQGVFPTQGWNPHLFHLLHWQVGVPPGKPNSNWNISVQFSHSVVSDSLWPHESQHARPPCPSRTPGVHPNSCVLSWWCHPTISCSVIPFSSCPQSLPTSGSFPMSQLFAWGGQSTEFQLQHQSFPWTPRAGLL